MKKPFALTLFFFALILFAMLLMQPLEILFGGDIPIFFPKGIIALKERNLLFLIQILMLIVVIPVYLLGFVITWKYREGNKKANYMPDFNHSTLAELIWWGIPCLIILAISIVTWMLCIELDPYKPIESKEKPLKIQVVALNWKWLFIYPEQQIASVNFLQFPAHIPLEFEITADAPMNSFWIPQLGGQIYAMPKMNTKLFLIANHEGDYRGASANLSGRGFAGMRFIARASSNEQFEKWVEEAKASPLKLDWKEYELLAKQSENHPVTLYSLEEMQLFHAIMMKYMEPM